MQMRDRAKADMEEVREVRGGWGREAMQVRNRAKADVEEVRDVKFPPPPLPLPDPDPALYSSLLPDPPPLPPLPCSSLPPRQVLLKPRASIRMRDRKAALEAERRARSEMARCDGLLRQAQADVLSCAQVVACTCTGAGEAAVASRYRLPGGRGSVGSEG